MVTPSAPLYETQLKMDQRRKCRMWNYETTATAEGLHDIGFGTKRKYKQIDGTISTLGASARKKKKKNEKTVDRMPKAFNKVCRSGPASARKTANSSLVTPNKWAKNKTKGRPVAWAGPGKDWQHLEPSLSFPPGSSQCLGFHRIEVHFQKLSPKFSKLSLAEIYLMKRYLGHWGAE